MPKAIKPTEFPPVPETSRGWYRSLRQGSTFHLIDYLGGLLCANRKIDQYNSEEAAGLGEMQYWGVCPRCYKKVIKDA